MDAMIAAARKELRAEAREPALKGERKLVTIMFADISGFTTLTLTNPPLLPIAASSSSSIRSPGVV
jgi:class 3 adenylate cyclase